MSSERVTKLAVVMGGLLVFVGIVMIGVSTCGFLGVVDLSVLASGGYRLLSLWALLIVGVLDLVSGVLLRIG